jgi:hypothetical protein
MTTNTGIILQTVKLEKIGITGIAIIRYTPVAFLTGELLVQTGKWKMSPVMVKTGNGFPRGHGMTLLTILL